MTWLLILYGRKPFWRALWASIRARTTPPHFFPVTNIEDDLNALETAKKILTEEQDYQCKYPKTWKTAKWWCYYFGTPPSSFYEGKVQSAVKGI